MGNLGKVHDQFLLLISIITAPIYIVHIILFFSDKKARQLIISDMNRYSIRIKLGSIVKLLYLLHNNPAFRKLFYHRLGPKGFLISWIRPGLKSLLINRTMSIGEGCYMPHPESTILSANSIGKNFTCMQLTTLGKSHGGNPTVGDNVSLGANVTIIGPISIGNNVTVGAGSVVVKDIPDNVIIAGVPAKIIKHL